MSDKPIIFSAPMVRAMLAGTKTQTRRIIGPGTSLLDGSPWPRGHRAQSWAWDRAWVDPGPSPAGNAGPYLKVPRDDDETVHRVYPIWWPGMRLWVREAWGWSPAASMPPSVMYRQFLTYRVNHEEAAASGPRVDSKWRPSIHMPRWASRLTLTVTDVRVQRLQDISEEDARAEGILTWAFWMMGQPDISAADIDRMTDATGEPPGSMRTGFSGLWNSIHGPEAWAANPWVAAISFSVTKGNIDALTASESTNV